MLFTIVGSLYTLDENKCSVNIKIKTSDYKKTMPQSTKVQNFKRDSSVKILEWPAKCPDINIVKDVRKIIFDNVYYGP